MHMGPLPLLKEEPHMCHHGIQLQHRATAPQRPDCMTASARSKQAQPMKHHQGCSAAEWVMKTFECSSELFSAEQDSRTANGCAAIPETASGGQDGTVYIVFTSFIHMSCIV